MRWTYEIVQLVGSLSMYYYYYNFHFPGSYMRKFKIVVDPVYAELLSGRKKEDVLKQERLHDDGVLIHVNECYGRNYNTIITSESSVAYSMLK